MVKPSIPNPLSLPSLPWSNFSSIVNCCLLSGQSHSCGVISNDIGSRPSFSYLPFVVPLDRLHQHHSTANRLLSCGLWDPKSCNPFPSSITDTLAHKGTSKRWMLHFEPSIFVVMVSDLRISASLCFLFSVLPGRYILFFFSARHVFLYSWRPHIGEISKPSFTLVAPVSRGVLLRLLNSLFTSYLFVDMRVIYCVEEWCLGRSVDLSSKGSSTLATQLLFSVPRLWLVLFSCQYS